MDTDAVAAIARAWDVVVRAAHAMVDVPPPPAWEAAVAAACSGASGATAALATLATFRGMDAVLAVATRQRGCTWGGMVGQLPSLAVRTLEPTRDAGAMPPLFLLLGGGSGSGGAAGMVVGNPFWEVAALHDAVASVSGAAMDAPAAVHATAAAAPVAAPTVAQLHAALRGRPAVVARRLSADDGAAPRLWALCMTPLQAAFLLADAAASAAGACTDGARVESAAYIVCGNGAAHAAPPAMWHADRGTAFFLGLLRLPRTERTTPEVAAAYDRGVRARAQLADAVLLAAEPRWRASLAVPLAWKRVPPGGWRGPDNNVVALRWDDGEAADAGAAAVAGAAVAPPLTPQLWRVMLRLPHPSFTTPAAATAARLCGDLTLWPCDPQLWLPTDIQRYAQRLGVPLAFAAASLQPAPAPTSVPVPALAPPPAPGAMDVPAATAADAATDAAAATAVAVTVDATAAAATAAAATAAAATAAPATPRRLTRAPSITAADLLHDIPVDGDSHGGGGGDGGDADGGAGTTTPVERHASLWSMARPSPTTIDPSFDLRGAFADAADGGSLCPPTPASLIAAAAANWPHAAAGTKRRRAAPSGSSSGTSGGSSGSGSSSSSSGGASGGGGGGGRAVTHPLPPPPPTTAALTAVALTTTASMAAAGAAPRPLPTRLAAASDPPQVGHLQGPIDAVLAALDLAAPATTAAAALPAPPAPLAPSAPRVSARKAAAVAEAAADTDADAATLPCSVDDERAALLPPGLRSAAAATAGGSGGGASGGASGGGTAVWHAPAPADGAWDALAPVSATLALQKEELKAWSQLTTLFDVATRVSSSTRFLDLCMLMEPAAPVRATVRKALLTMALRTAVAAASFNPTAPYGFPPFFHATGPRLEPRTGAFVLTLHLTADTFVRVKAGDALETAVRLPPHVPPPIDGGGELDLSCVTAAELDADAAAAAQVALRALLQVRPELLGESADEPSAKRGRSGRAVSEDRWCSACVRLAFRLTEEECTERLQEALRYLKNPTAIATKTRTIMAAVRRG